MKKITLLLLVAIVPFLSIAQKRSSKKTPAKQEVKVKLSEYEYMNITGIEQDVDVTEEDGEARGAAGPEVKFIKRLKSKARLFIRFNSGKITPEILEMNKLARECTSMMLALNAATKYGWDLVSVNVVKEEGATVNHMYLKRKR